MSSMSYSIWNTKLQSIVLSRQDHIISNHNYGYFRKRKHQFDFWNRFKRKKTFNLMKWLNLLMNLLEAFVGCNSKSNKYCYKKDYFIHLLVFIKASLGFIHSSCSSTLMIEYLWCGMNPTQGEELVVDLCADTKLGGPAFPFSQVWS